MEDLERVTECLEKIYLMQILEPVCDDGNDKRGLLLDHMPMHDEIARRLLRFASPLGVEPWCRDMNMLYSTKWANNELVQKALHIREVYHYVFTQRARANIRNCEGGRTHTGRIQAPAMSSYDPEVARPQPPITQVASIIFLDYPVGTGFSYSNTTTSYSSSDTISTQHNYTFLRKWLLAHPEFIKNRLYVTGDSYGGKIAPMLALEIAKGSFRKLAGNEAGREPIMSLKGYIVGNAVTDENADINERIPYAHRMALISDKQFEVFSFFITKFNLVL
ncbi:hypothetical protein SASPL_132037 [Salvia splendens]|uniref:Uncharacterized protein n=1 Tax=Salvia splendens TaxID=180675 RepID=A0A8X8XBA6_SALSN|nr:hypothetical protein SASPL_132037 [Salvia splendens]